MADNSEAIFTMACLDPQSVRALETWIDSLPLPRPDRAQAIGFALRDTLVRLGHLPHLEPPEGPGWQ